MIGQRERRQPPLLRGDAGAAEVKHRKSHFKRPKAQERRVAEAIGGKRVAGSGSGEEKGDVARVQRSFPIRVECKRSMGKASVSFKAEHLIKISSEAMAAGAYPALAIQFDREVMAAVARACGRMPASEDWVAVPLNVFQAMLEALGEEGILG